MCGKRFDRPSRMKEHVKNLHGMSIEESNGPKREKKHICATCGKGFDRPSRLKDHMINHHGKFKEASNEEKEKNIVEQNHSCDICQKSFDRSSKLKEHIRMLHELSIEEREMEKKYSCDICGHNFDRPFRLKSHQRVHFGDATFVCDICNAPFNALSLLNSHQENKHPEDYDRKRTCETCNQTFRTPAEMQTHKITHTGIKPFACDECDASFKNKSSLIFHHQNIHLREPGKKYIYCEVCNMKGKCVRWLNRHKKKCTGQKPTCEFCGKQFERGNVLVNHIRTHTGGVLFFCDKCPRKFHSEETYSLHSSKCQGSSCGICGTKFKSADDLEKHKLEYSNSNCTLKSMEYFPCDVCNKKFISASNLEKHKIKYSDLKCVDNVSFPCNVCKIKFKSQDNLDKHKLKYPNSNCELKCQWCKFDFNNKADFEAHVASEHENHCDLCSRKFFKRGNLIIHMKKVHEMGKFSKLMTETDIEQEFDDSIEMDDNFYVSNEETADPLSEAEINDDIADEEMVEETNAVEITAMVDHVDNKEEIIEA